MHSNGDKHQPSCLVAHDVVNKLSAIIGFCDLLKERVEPHDSECAKRLGLIHDLAQSAAKELVDHQVHRAAAIRNVETRDKLVV
jgi:light-regulated signal transduction histidine kinase (bacteriophytochrome)